MRFYTLAVQEFELDILNRVYQNHFVENNNPHVFFHARHNDVEILAYKSGKVLLQGNDVSNTLIAIKTHLGREDYEAIGSDEVGTGDVFGPIVVCSVYTSVKDIEFLEALNVRDSKNISDAKIIQIAPRIAKRLTHSLLILNPRKYNSLYDKGHNLNKIKALLHNQAIIKTTEKIDHQVPVILDQFSQPQLYFNYIKDETLIYRDIEFHTNAENVHIAVAAASIIARYAFLVKLRDYSNKIGYDLLKGANKEVDSLIKEIFDNKGLNTLGLVAKLNYKNVTKQNLT